MLESWTIAMVWPAAVDAAFPEREDVVDGGEVGGTDAERAVWPGAAAGKVN